MITSAELLAKYPIISDQVDKRELGLIIDQAIRICFQHSTGDVVEFGCYVGTTSLFLQRVLSALAPHKTLFVYDSFAGLPPKSTPDHSPAGEQFKTGELRATKRQFIENFKHANVKLPVIHKGWFNEVPDSAVPSEICLAFLDGDYYESIKCSLKLIERKLTPGALIIVDDYASDSLPGARRAVDEWARAKNVPVRTQASLAFISV